MGQFGSKPSRGGKTILVGSSRTAEADVTSRYTVDDSGSPSVPASGKSPPSKSKRVTTGITGPEDEVVYYETRVEPFASNDETKRNKKLAAAEIAAADGMEEMLAAMSKNRKPVHASASASTSARLDGSKQDTSGMNSLPAPSSAFVQKRPHVKMPAVPFLAKDHMDEDFE